MPRSYFFTPPKKVHIHFFLPVAFFPSHSDPPGLPDFPTSPRFYDRHNRRFSDYTPDFPSVIDERSSTITLDSVPGVIVDERRMFGDHTWLYYSRKINKN